MKREVKFKAWHKTEKLMCDVDTLTNEGAFLIGVKPGEDEIIQELRMVIPAPLNGRFCENDEFELLEFTGLKDKNGKDIFEGDILKLQYPFRIGAGVGCGEGFDYREITVSVSFDGGCFWFTGKGFTDCNWRFYDNYEIIGNIFENPELI